MSLRLFLTPSNSPALLPIRFCNAPEVPCQTSDYCTPVPLMRGDDIKLYYPTPPLALSGPITFYLVGLCPLNSTSPLPTALGTLEVRSFGGYLSITVPSSAPLGTYRLCFLSVPDGVVRGCTPPVVVIDEPCYTGLVEFGACESILGYNYYQWPVGYPRFQRARIWAYLDNETFDEESDVYYGSDGGVLKTYARIRRKFTLLSKWAPTYVQEWLKLGLAHDYFVIQDARFGTLQVVSEAGLQIERPQRYPPISIARGKAEVVQHAYNKYNNFCANCL